MKKKQYVVALLFVAVALAFASTSGPNGAGTGTNDASAGTGAWSGPGNITTENGVGANASVSSLQTPTQNLQATNFGFSIPAGSTIQGIFVEIKHSSSNAFVKDSSIRVMKGGVAVGTEHADTATFWPLSFTFAAYGSSSDLWGTTWISSDVNASNFGVQISAQCNQVISDTAFVDFIRITVTFAPAAGGGRRRIIQTKVLQSNREASS